MYVNRGLIAKILLLCIIVSFVFPVFSLATDSFLWSNYDATSTVSSTIGSQSENPNSLNLECGSAILIEQNTGKVLYEHNIHEQLRPASVTKVMTILLIMEALDSGVISLDTPIPCSENASSMGGSQIWLDVKESLTVNEMLKAICVVSANDCTVAMAEYLAGSEEAFVFKLAVSLLRNVDI